MEGAMSRRSLRCSDSTGDYTALVKLCVLRILCSPLLRTKLTSRLWGDEAITLLLGVDEKDAPENPKEIKALLREKLAAADAERAKMTGLVFENLELLGEELGFSELDREIMGLLVLARIEEVLHDSLELAGRLTDPHFYRLIATALKRDLSEVVAALAPGSRLVSTRLFQPQRAVVSFEEKMNMADALPHALTRKNRTLEDVVAFAAVRAGTTELGRGDYQHISRHMEILLPYLGHAVAQHRRGVNVLLYGPPGTGKTELAKVLAQELGLTLYEVRFADEDGDPLPPDLRIGSYTLMQATLCRRDRAVILFDEIEDILPVDGWSFGWTNRESTRRKAWLNRTLEENPVPAVWIGNQVSHIDPAFLRRFDYVIELGAPPRSIRSRMLRAQLKDLPVSDAWLERKADEPALTPGIVAKLAQVLETHNPDPSSVESRFDLMAQARLEAQGNASTRGRYPFPDRYRTDLLNASADPLAVAHRLGLRGRGNALFYGPPGTGKTAYAHFLARNLDRPLLVKRASDLLSAWVGETEKLMSAMFEEAAQDNAVLLLDEADSFLQDRRRARHSWEITQVNELLTRMEEFEGIFLCATNFPDHLDLAAMRRFALKVRFEPLKPEQARSLFLDTLEAQGVDVPEGLEQHRLWRELQALPGLTPGDFVAARKALDLGAVSWSAQGLINALREELALRPEVFRRPIGFAA